MRKLFGKIDTNRNSLFDLNFRTQHSVPTQFEFIAQLFGVVFPLASRVRWRENKILLFPIELYNSAK